MLIYIFLHELIIVYAYYFGDNVKIKSCKIEKKIYVRGI